MNGRKNRQIDEWMEGLMNEWVIDEIVLHLHKRREHIRTKRILIGL